MSIGVKSIYLFCIFFLYQNLQLKAQVNIDSLFNIWETNTRPPLERLEAINLVLQDRYWQMHHTDKGGVLATAMYNLALECHSKKYESLGLLFMGRAIASGNEIHKSIELFNKALKLAEEINDIELQAKVNGHIAIMAWQSRDFKLFLHYTMRSAALWEKTKNEKEYAWALHNLGYAYQETGDYKNAIACYHKSLDLATKIGYPLAIGNCLAYLGETYQLMGDYQTAQSYFRQSLEYKQKNNIDYEKAWTMVKMGEGYIALKKYEEALEICKEVYDSVKNKTVDDDALRFSCNCLYKSYKALGNDKVALSFYEKWVSMKDSLDNSQTTTLLLEGEFSKQLLRDSLAQVEKQRKLQESYNEEVRQKNRIRNIILVVAVFILIIAGALLSRLRILRRAKAAVENEKHKSDMLLLNILPESVAEELKAKGSAEARHFEEVTVMFTDFKGFTSISEKLQPEELVAEIDSFFKAFDHIIGRYHIEKIKTIGDSYMCAAGLPETNTKHAQDMINAALDIQEFMERHQEERKNSGKELFEIRIGIHSGPVVAGIVGVKKFAYDIWGDTVNIASRMESAGEPGKVNISSTTYELVKDLFHYRHRGKIRVKHKGEVDMYFVEGRVGEVSGRSAL
jgi:adenylate cyclase